MLPELRFHEEVRLGEVGSDGVRLGKVWLGQVRLGYVT